MVLGEMMPTDIKIVKPYREIYMKSEDEEWQLTYLQKSEKTR